MAKVELSHAPQHVSGYQEWLRSLPDRAKLSPTEMQLNFESLFGVLNDRWRQDFIDYMNAIPVDDSQLH